MQVGYQKHIPLFALIVMSLFWAYYYQSTFWLNDFGRNKEEWWLLIDGLIALPILCFVFIKSKKEALLKALAYSGLMVLLGSLVIPESNKFVWHYLEFGRYIVLAAFVLLEIITISTVVLAIRAALQDCLDPDDAIARPIQNRIGDNMISNILCFEARVWTYLLFSKQIDTSKFDGDIHFYGHKKDDAQTNSLGFILLMVFELPIMHVVLHFAWSPIAANIISLLTIMGLAFFIAEYKAMSIRPISVTHKSVVIRYGVYHPLTLAFTDIKQLGAHNQFVKRDVGVKRYNASGCPNVCIQLKNGEVVYLGINSPTEFINTVAPRLSV
ncbi:MAG: hypothetical protein WA981_05890 [Glaciecola sp.]